MEAVCGWVGVLFVSISLCERLSVCGVLLSEVSLVSCSVMQSKSNGFVKSNGKSVMLGVR